MSFFKRQALWRVVSEPYKAIIIMLLVKRPTYDLRTLPNGIVQSFSRSPCLNNANVEPKQFILASEDIFLHFLTSPKLKPCVKSAFTDPNITKIYNRSNLFSTKIKNVGRSRMFLQVMKNYF